MEKWIEIKDKNATNFIPIKQYLKHEPDFWKASWKVELGND